MPKKPSEGPEAHRLEPASEEELAAELQKIQQRRLIRAAQRQMEQENQRRPPGAASVASFQTIRPGTLRTDPFERAPVDPEMQAALEGGEGPQQPSAAVGALPYPKVVIVPDKGRRATQGDDQDWVKRVEAIGELFVDTAQKVGSESARKEMRDNVMKNAHRLAKDINEVEKLWRFALELDRNIGSERVDKRTESVRTGLLRDYLSQGDGKS